MVARDPTRLARSWLTAVLDGKQPGGSDALSFELVWQVGLRQGVLGLCHRMLQHGSRWSESPLDFRLALAQHVKRAAAIELLVARELARVLRCLRTAGIGPLLIKGVPMAYTLYPAPYLRPRSDTDLLFASRAETEQALEYVVRTGYTARNAVSGAFVSHQIACAKTDAMGVVHTLDLHWKISETHRFANTFVFSELQADAIPIGGLSPDANGLGTVHALLLACMHRMTHAPSGDANRLIWLYDIHLLAESLSRGQWNEVVTHSRRKRIGRTCLDGLREARRVFHTRLPRSGIDALVEAAKSEPFGPDSMRSRWRFELMNFRSLPTWPARRRLLREHLFPSPAYMAAKYRTRSRLLLPALYALRFARGLPKLFR